MKTGEIVGLGIAGLGVWWLGSQYNWFGLFGTPATAAPVTPTSSPAATTPATPISTPNPTPTTPVTITPPASTAALTVADAATLAYNSGITQAAMAAINSQVDANLQAGIIPIIGGNSVLAYELGWGGAAKGVSETVLGQTYTFDGTNWNHVGAPGPGMSGYGMGRGRRTMTGASRFNYQRKSRFA